MHPFGVAMPEGIRRQLFALMLDFSADRSAINGEPLALLEDSSQQITIRLNEVEKGALLVTQLPG